jgi:hypothetical protein
MSMSATFSFTAKRSCMYTMTSPRHQFARLNASKITHSFNRKALKVSHSFRHSSMMASTAVRTAPVSKVQHALSAIVGFCVALAIAASPAAAEETFSGIPRIVDGDTIVVRLMSLINVEIVSYDEEQSTCLSKAATYILSQSHLSAKREGHCQLSAGGRHTSETLWHRCSREQAILQKHRRRTVHMWCAYMHVCACICMA